MKLLNTRRKHAAFTLVEVALAMGIASFCLVVVLGLVPLGIDNERESFGRDGRQQYPYARAR